MGVKDRNPKNLVKHGRTVGEKTRIILRFPDEAVEEGRFVYL